MLPVSEQPGAIRSIRYHSTNCFFVASRQPGRYLAVDLGWPGTLRLYQRLAKQAGVAFNQAAWAIVTHFHLDHAGLLSEFVQQGIECVVFEHQLAAIDPMERLIRKDYPSYPLIDQRRLSVLPLSAAGLFLERAGIAGELLATPGHSDDSLSLLTSQHSAITGDLYPPAMLAEDDQQSRQSWRLLYAKGAQTIYPGHAAAFTL